jgi:hypothetical protein
MAKAKKAPTKGTKAEPGPRRTVLTIKGTEEWRSWLERLAAYVRTPASTIVDHALIKYAREAGFKEEAPVR